MRDGAQFQGEFARNVDFRAVALAIIKSDAMHFIILLQSLHQTGG